MRMSDFSEQAISQARELVLLNYAEERAHVCCLPCCSDLPCLGSDLEADLRSFATSGLGVALWQEDRLLGFLCCHQPWDHHFGLSKGVFSPLHGHGAVAAQRTRIYDLLYQAAAQKWVQHEILSHCVALYAHDQQTLRCFFDNGFGNRCVDAVRTTESLIDIEASAENMEFREVRHEEARHIAALSDQLIAHLRQTPMFMPYFQQTQIETVQKWMAQEGHHYLGAYEAGRLVAYIRLQQNGENFACDYTGMMNISGAFMLPEYRGSGLYTVLLNHLLGWLRQRGFTLCGVDFESFNYTARGFWLKYFTAYTNTVVRRVDERIVR